MNFCLPSLFFALLSFCLLHAEAIPLCTNDRLQPQKETLKTALGSEKVIASDYCSFLNAAARRNLENFYDEKMALFVRSGDPGNYIYLVATEEQTTPILYVNQLSAAQYFYWKQNNRNSDDFLSSNDALSLPPPTLVILF